MDAAAGDENIFGLSWLEHGIISDKHHLLQLIQHVFLPERFFLYPCIYIERMDTSANTQDRQLESEHDSIRLIRKISQTMSDENHRLPRPNGRKMVDDLLF